VDSDDNYRSSFSPAFVHIFRGIALLCCFLSSDCSFKKGHAELRAQFFEDLDDMGGHPDDVGVPLLTYFEEEMVVVLQVHVLPRELQPSNYPDFATRSGPLTKNRTVNVGGKFPILMLLCCSAESTEMGL